MLIAKARWPLGRMLANLALDPSAAKQDAVKAWPETIGSESGLPVIWTGLANASAGALLLGTCTRPTQSASITVLAGRAGRGRRRVTGASGTGPACPGGARAGGPPRVIAKETSSAAQTAATNPNIIRRTTDTFISHA